MEVTNVKKVWAMPNGKTFKVKPIKELIMRTVGGGNANPRPLCK